MLKVGVCASKDEVSSSQLSRIDPEIRITEYRLSPGPNGFAAHKKKSQSHLKPTLNNCHVMRCSFSFLSSVVVVFLPTPLFDLVSGWSLGLCLYDLLLAGL